MRKKRCYGVILVIAAVLLTGCGEAPYELTEKEQKLIVNYSAHVVSKYNMYQMDGLSHVLEGQETSETEKTETPESSAQQEESVSGGGAGAAVLEDGVQETLEAIYADTGLTVSYAGHEITDTYVESDIYALKPSHGKVFAVLNLLAENVTEETVVVNNMAAGDTFSLNCTLDTGDIWNTPAVLSLLTNEFLTYEGSIEPGAAEELVLIFEIPAGTVSIENLVLKINKNNNIYEINL